MVAEDLRSGFEKDAAFFGYTCSFDSAWTRLVDLIYESPEPPLDYLAIDYYDPFAAHALRLPTWNDRFGLKRNIQEHLLDGITSKWWDWKELPEGLSFFVRSLERFNLPILIAENGMAHRCQSNEACFIRKDKLHRSAFIRRNVQLVTRLKQEGLPLIGYLYWSLVDNYEWGTYSARFGLYSLKFLESLDRHEFAFSGDNAAEAYAKAIAEARLAMAE